MVASTTSSELHRCLSDVVFPANKRELLGAAERNGCDTQTLHALSAIPSGTYTNVAQIASSVTIADERDRPDLPRAAAARPRDAAPKSTDTTDDFPVLGPMVEHVHENPDR
ncbi:MULTISPECIES: DUF2795 domain-containing protein [unclassified Mycobacterium]|uniref:DUF2795 domain-containing protein n=1 Tax=unclassified Mycobacterium TaxID=2642494 RepID=UPI00080015CA|nr:MULTISPECIES: DUF2795 domain-containing protein [unclassified Mycobacterium]OBG71567.1 hypothetical protein A5700_11350 [Mycobacterium sp. E1214]OBH31956.1 hypothetical protein A5693_00035 [Mycobacterium sp. E1319]